MTRWGIYYTYCYHGSTPVSYLHSLEATTYRISSVWWRALDIYCTRSSIALLQNCPPKKRTQTQNRREEDCMTHRDCSSNGATVLSRGMVYLVFVRYIENALSWEPRHGQAVALWRAVP